MAPALDLTLTDLGAALLLVARDDKTRTRSPPRTSASAEVTALSPRASLTLLLRALLLQWAVWLRAWTRGVPGANNEPPLVEQGGDCVSERELADLERHMYLALSMYGWPLYLYRRSVWAWCRRSIGRCILSTVCELAR